MSKCMYCGKEWFTNMSKWMYEDVCKDCANKYIKVKERKTMKTSAYDLTLKIISIMGDIDALLDEKSKTYDISDRERLDKEIDRKEAELFDLKNILKKAGVVEDVSDEKASNTGKGINSDSFKLGVLFVLSELVKGRKKGQILKDKRIAKLELGELNLSDDDVQRSQMVSSC